LFDGHPWFVVPGPRTADEDLQRVETCVRMLGAKPVCIDADTHDRLMALISHVPQIVASVLMQVVGERARADGLAFAGRGLVDTTRLAAASSEWLASVIDTNADHIGAALDDVIAQLQKIRTEIGEGRSVEDLFEQASTWREVLLDRRRAME
jgi:prephenate dehydrogenase